MKSVVFNEKEIESFKKSGVIKYAMLALATPIILYNTNRQNNFYCQCEAIGKSKEAFEYGISRNMQTRDVGRFFSR